MKIEEVEELVTCAQNLRTQVSYGDFEGAHEGIDDIHRVCKTISASLKSVEEKRNESEKCLIIRINRLEKEDYVWFRKKLKKRIFKLVSRVPCTVTVTDELKQDIRHVDGW